jgi:GTPase involved in cell partitioning and DNA repair
VPVGTQVFLHARDGERTLIVDAVDTSPHLVAQGGRGGWGNATTCLPPTASPC